SGERSLLLGQSALRFERRLFLGDRPLSLETDGGGLLRKAAGVGGRGLFFNKGALDLGSDRVFLLGETRGFSGKRRFFLCKSTLEFFDLCDLTLGVTLRFR